MLCDAHTLFTICKVKHVSSFVPHYIKTSTHSDLSALQIQHLCTQSKGCHVECLHIDLKPFP